MQFNRAVAIELQGREAEALDIMHQIHRDHPDYLFARTHLADRCIVDGNLDEAKALLAPIAQKKRLHTSEYAAWCSANIDLVLATGDRKAAHSLIAHGSKLPPTILGSRFGKAASEGGAGCWSA